MTPPVSDRPRRRERGFTLLEVAIMLALLVPLMAALATTTTVFTQATTQSQNRTRVNSESERILKRIAAELLQGCSRIDHAIPGGTPMPHPDDAAGGSSNAAYDYTGGAAVPIDLEMPTLARDGVEHWHPVVTTRRFYIYCTYERFDTLEYQKVRTPLDDMSHVDAVSGSVSQPWSAPRKIFVENGDVILRIRRVPGPDLSVLLGTGVESLRFHLNADGSIIVRLTTSAGPAGSVLRARRTAQITVAPRNALS